MIRRIGAGESFQAALDGATPGDTLVLEPGVTYEGPFTLRRKDEEEWITIQTAALEALPEGRRVGPEDAPQMPRLVSPGGNEPVLRTEAGAHHYRLLGVEFTKASDAAVVSDLITFGDGSAAQNSLEMVPHHLRLDRCYIHGTPDTPLKRGVALNSAETEVFECTISDAKLVGQDSQAIGGWNGPGPYRIVNNTLEASGENVMFGGADPAIRDLVPSDIEIRGNWITKPLAWRGRWTVKNLLELKNARRVRIEGNLLENNWPDAQVGFALVFKSTNQNGTAPWSVTEEVDFINNIVRNSTHGLNLLGSEDGLAVTRANHIRIVNNLFEEIDGIFLQISETHDVRVEHNTALQGGAMIIAYGAPSNGFVFRDNILPHNLYGVHGDDEGTGLPSLRRYFPGFVWERNVVPGARADQYPADSSYPGSLDDVGFVDRADGDYRLGPTSPYLGQATDGSDIGCLIDDLAEAAAARDATLRASTPAG
jgi:Right handed beta helix region